MLKYEIVSILRNKAAYIFLLVVLLFGLKATVELQRSITSSQDTNYIKRELQYELVMHRQLLESELATARRDAGDAKRRKFNTNAIQFRKWRIEELQELIALLEVGGTESQQFQKEYKAYGVICSIVSYQMFVYPERGCSPVEVRCADMFQKWGRQLGSCATGASAACCCSFPPPACRSWPIWPFPPISSRACSGSRPRPTACSSPSTRA